VCHITSFLNRLSISTQILTQCISSPVFIALLLDIATMSYNENVPPPEPLAGSRQPYEEQRELIPLRRVLATAYARTWACDHIDKGLFTSHDLDLLQHVNCSYLSSDLPPTLLALKQHAQALAILIARLSVSTTFGTVGDDVIEDDELLRPFHANEAYDWLNDLQVMYKNDDEHHHLPLRSLLNKIKEEKPKGIIHYHCPLEENKRHKDGCGPWRSPLNLLEHANTCLEILDDIYNEHGGLFAVLPSEESPQDDPTIVAVKNTLLGQWLLQHKHLYNRIHDLEIGHGNVLDILDKYSGLRLSEASGGSNDEGSENLPQEYFAIKAGAGKVHLQIHKLLDDAEAEATVREKVWRDNGVVTDSSMNRRRARSPTTREEEDMDVDDRNEDEQNEALYARGLIYVDTVSRFYRRKGQGSGSAVFVIPLVQSSKTAERGNEVAQMARRVTPPLVGPGSAEELYSICYKQKGEMRELQTANDGLQQRIREQQADIAEFNQRNDDLRDKNLALSQQMEEATKEVALLQRESEFLKEQVQEQERLNEILRRNEGQFTGTTAEGKQMAKNPIAQSQDASQVGETSASPSKPRAPRTKAGKIKAEKAKATKPKTTRPKAAKAKAKAKEVQVPETRTLRRGRSRTKAQQTEG
jgi:hypothetical protein